MMLSLAQVQVFVTLCDTLHFTRAAERLSISQPTVSKEIRALERALGVRLLARSPAGTTLSEAGERLAPQARAVLREASTFEAMAAEVRRRFRRQVTIAASPSIVNRILPDTLREVDDHQLDISLLALEVETGDVVAAVDGGRADIGIGHHLVDPVRATKRRIGDDELRVVVSRHLAPAGRQTIDLRQLDNVPLLIWPRERSPVYHDAMLDACRSRGLDPLLLTGTTRISGSWSYFLDDARAFALAPQDFAAHEAGGNLAALSMEPPAYVPLEVVWREGNAEVDQILEILWALTKDRRAGTGPDRRPAGPRGPARDGAPSPPRS